MADSGESDETRVTVVGRVGSWLGLVMFIAILAIPTPSSVREVVHNAFGDTIRTDVAKALKIPAAALTQVGQEAGPESRAYRRAVADAIERRVRVMVAATISASCAFMMPVATPPNAIVFGTGHVEMGRMARSGLIINLIGVVLVTATFYLIVRPILGIDPTSIPDWAQ